MSRRKMHPAPTRVAPSVEFTAWWGALLVFATVLAYSNSLNLPFIFDDVPAVVRNETIRALGSSWTPPEGGVTTANRPVVNFTLALNYATSGEAPWSYHATNLLIHALAGLALFGVVRRTLQRPAIAPALAARGSSIAAMTALLWLLHPLQTESVTSVAQRTESLCGLFFLATFYCFVRGMGAARPFGWWGAGFFACLAGMGSKELMVTAPPLLLLFDRTFAAGSFASALQRRGWVHAAFFATTLLTLWLVLRGGGARGTAAGFGLGVEWWQYALKQADAVVTYLRLTFVPWPLVADYGTAVAGSAAEVWWQLPLVLALGGVTCWALVRRPVAGFFGAWFFVILAPSSSLVPLVEQTVAEHRMYLPLAAPILGAVILVAQRATDRLILIVAPVAMLAAALTFARNRDYRSELGLWRDTAEKVPDNPRAHYNVGSILLESGRAEEALPALQRAARLAPADAGMQINLGNALRQLGRTGEALAAFRRAVELKPRAAIAHFNLGRGFVDAEAWDAARAAFEKAVELDPQFAEARLNLGALHLARGRAEEAAADSAAALAVDPHLTLARRNLGFAFLALNEFAAARGQLQQVVSEVPDDAVALRGLAFANLRLGRRSEALRQVEAALALDPQDAAARALRAELQRNSR